MFGLADAPDPHAELFSKLNNIMETARDAQATYEMALDSVRSDAMKQLFQRNCKQQRAFANQLAEAIQEAGGKADQDPSIESIARRGWVSLHSKLTGDVEADPLLRKFGKGWLRLTTDHLSTSAADTLLAEIERLERHALEQHDEVLQRGDVPPALRNLLEDEVQRVRDELLQVQRIQEQRARQKR